MYDKGLDKRVGYLGGMGQDGASAASGSDSLVNRPPRLPLRGRDLPRG